MKEFLDILISGEPLSLAQAEAVMDIIMSGDATDAQIGGFLIALKIKGESSDEIAGFVKSMRRNATKVTLDDANAVDGCGTGGDGSDSFNISTAAAIVAAASGVTVAKHGNRSVSSKCGSSDLLAQTGGNINPGVAACEEIINKIGFGFMFAPSFHPAMKYAIGPRRELGTRTVFNILGPMTNPASVRRQVIGVYEPSLIPLLTDSLLKLDSKHIIVLHSHDGLDEFSISAPTEYFEIHDDHFNSYKISAAEVGLKEYKEGSLVGGDAEFNHAILMNVLDNKESAYRGAVLFNAGALIYVSGKVENIKDGVELARTALESGKAKELLSNWIELSNSFK